MALNNPHITSGLIETPAPAAENDAPKAGIVLVVGTAGSGPTTSVEFDDATRAYEVFGTAGTLARDVELAVEGANFGARVAGTRATPRVVGLRLKTGTPSSAEFFSDVAKTERVMRIETSEASEKAWKLTFTGKTVIVDNPTTGKQDRFFIDRDGEGIANSAASPLALADALRKHYEGQLFVEVFTDQAKWELGLSDAMAAGSEPKLVTSRYETTLRLDRFDNADMDGFKPGSVLWVADKEGSREPYDFTALEAIPVHNRAIPASLNKDARFYAITAGGAVEAPKDQQEVRIERLADAKRVGVSQTNTLLNIRTTGVGAAGDVTLADAGSRAGSRVSEGYFRIRNHFVGNFDPSAAQTVHLTDADHIVAAVSVANKTVGVSLDGSSAELTAEVDGVTLKENQVVFLDAQTTAAENGLYEVELNGSGELQLTEVALLSALADDVTIDVLGGTDAGVRYVVAAGAIVVDAPAEEAYVVEYDAPEGIADAAGTLATAFGFAAGATKEEVSTDRLGDHFQYDGLGFLRLDMQPIFDRDGQPLPLDLNLIETRVVWSDGTARILLNKSDFDANMTPSGAYDDAYVFVSYDSCVFSIGEKATKSQLAGETSLAYAVSGDTVSFSKPLPHALVVRGLRVTQYRLGSDLEIRRRSSGNELIVHGEGKQPGEAGGPVGKMEVILGADYGFEPEFPVEGASPLLGGSSGANADVETTVAALDQALAESKDQDYKIIVASGVYADDVIEGYDPVTGVPVQKNAGLLDTLSAHQKRVAQNGAAGVVYAAVRPMLPATQTGRYTDPQIRRRFRELTQADVYDGLRLATQLNGKSLPTFFLFDAPFAVNLGGAPEISDGVAFYAGIRSAMTNETALYQLEMPTSIAPLYRYNASDVHMPSLLAEARVNTWSDRRGEVRLADERTAAGLVPNAKGRLVPSGFRSGIALLATNDFLQASVAQLRGLLGPLPTTGVDTLKGSVVTILQGVANRTAGVQRVDLRDDRDITINALGGNALGMTITVFIKVAGELRVIKIHVGAVTETQASSAQSGAAGIPIAQ